MYKILTFILRIYRGSLAGLAIIALLVFVASCATSAVKPKTIMVSGTVMVCTAANITIRDASGINSTYALTPTMAVLIDGFQSTADRLKSGFLVNVSVVAGAASAIYARTPITDAWGNVTAIGVNSVTIVSDADGSRTFGFAPTIPVTIYTNSAPLSKVTVGMLADVKFSLSDPTTATNIDVVAPDGGHFRGRIASINESSITLDARKDGTLTLKIAASATVTLDGDKAKLTDLRKGQFAQVTAVDDVTVTVINAYSQALPSSD